MYDSSYQKFSNNDTNQTPKNVKLITKHQKMLN